MKKLRFEKGFTLAESLITLTILGVVAAITVPSLINKQMESANRTKLKKAMATYEKVLNQMIIDNDIKGDVSALNGDNCATTRPYFKIIENGGTNCQFKTADRVWWDITDIENPIISLKDEITTNNRETMKSNAQNSEIDKTTYSMIGRYDDDGVLRINDNGWEQKQKDANAVTNKKYMAKLWGFLGVDTQSPIDKIVNSYNSCSGDGCCYTQFPGKFCLQKDVACENVNKSCSIPSHIPALSCNFTKTDDCVAIKWVNTKTNNDVLQIQITGDKIYSFNPNNNTPRTVCEKKSNSNLYCYTNTPGAGTSLNGIEYDSNGEPIAFYNYNRTVCTKNSCSWNPNPFDYNAKYTWQDISDNYAPSTTSAGDKFDIVIYKLAMENLMK